MSILNRDWERIQERAFTKWINSHLKRRGMKVEDIGTDFMDGVKLINLYEAISEEALGKHYKEPKMKFHQIANLNTVVEKINGFVSSVGIKVQFSAEQIYEGDKRQILGMIWCLIHKFEIQDISEDELSAKEGLLLWCQKKTAGYNDVKVSNFHNSWVDGLAFCALIHRHRPDLLDFDALSKENKKENLELAFEVAERDLDIPQLLEADDLLDVARPDEKVVMTYVAYYWKKFASSQKSEKAANVIGKNISRQKELEQLQSDYEQRAQALLEWVAQKQADHADISAEHFGNSLEAVSERNTVFKAYKNNEKPGKHSEKLDLEVLLTNLRSQQKNAGLPVYTPPEELSTETINKNWSELHDTQQAYEKALNERVNLMKRLEILLNRFRSRSANVKQWQAAKIESFANEDVSKYDTIAALQARLKVLEIFNDEVTGVENTLNQSKDIGQEVVDAQHAAADEVSATLAEIEQDQTKVTESLTNLKQQLEEVLASLEAIMGKCLEFSRRAESLNLLLQEAGLALGEPVQASSVSDVEVYESVLTKIGDDLQANESSLQELTDLNQEITEAGQDPSMYSSQNLDILSEKFNAIKEQYEQKNQEVAQEKEKQIANAELLSQFAEGCTEFSSWTEEKKNEVNAEQEGELQQQIEALQALSESLGTESEEKLTALGESYQKLEEADISEQSEMSTQALHALNDQLKTLIKKRIEAIEQQIQEEKAANVSEEQIDEFKKTFDHFDKDKSGSLNKLEFKACLASLGEDVSDEEFEKTFSLLDTSGDGQISFSEFLQWISATKREGTGYEDVVKAFEVLSGGNNFITEAQLRSSGMAPEEVDFLLQKMPETEGGYDFRAYLAAQYGQN